MRLITGIISVGQCATDPASHDWGRIRYVLERHTFLDSRWRGPDG